MKRPGESPTKRLAHINDSKKTGRLKKLRAQAKGSCAKKAARTAALTRWRQVKKRVHGLAKLFRAAWPTPKQKSVEQPIVPLYLSHSCLSMCTSNTGKQGTV